MEPGGERTGWRLLRITPRALMPIAVVASGVALGIVLADTALWPIAALILFLLAAVGVGPIRSAGGRSTDSEDYRRLMNEEDFRKPPNERDLL